MNHIYGWLGFIFLIIFISVSWMVWTGFPPLIKFEEKIALLFYELFAYPDLSYSNGLFNSILTFLVNYGSAPFLSAATVVIAFFMFLKGYYLLALWYVAIVSTGGISGFFLKRIFQRQRPVNHLPDDTGYSFPSGHAIASSLFFSALLLVFFPMIENDHLRLVLNSLTSLTWFGILFSRLYFHAHHLGDLIVGASFGIAWVSSSFYFSHYLLTQLVQ